MGSLQEQCPRPSPDAEALRWQAVAGALGLAQTQRSRSCVSLKRSTSIRVLAEVVEALQTADSHSLLPLLACLRHVPVKLPSSLSWKIYCKCMSWETDDRMLLQWGFDGAKTHV